MMSNPPIASFVSANGPSVTIVFPSRTRMERAWLGGSQLVAADPDAPRLEVVQPAENSLSAASVGSRSVWASIFSPFQQISMRNLAPRSKLSSPRQPPVVGTP
jgi:hypothetical protein